MSELPEDQFLAWLETRANDAVLIARLRAFGVDCVTHGDMTPAGRRMLERILDGVETR